MLAIALNEDELLQLKLLLRDIQLIQKLNNVFDYNAIEILSFKVIEHLNNEENFMPKIKEISDEEIDNAVVLRYENVGDEKLFPNHTDKDIWMNGFYEGAKWYRELLKNNK
jgi:hypothetical protein